MQPNGAVMKPIAAALVLFLSSVPAWTQSTPEDEGNRPDPPMLGPHLARGEAHGQAHQGGGSPNMIYHNGDIMPTAVTQAIFWGTSWANPSFEGDKISGLDSWYQGVGGSDYAKTCDEYTGLNNDQVLSGISNLGHAIDTSAAPSHAPRTSAILNEVCKLVTKPVANGYYAVYVDTPRGGAGYCAWHSWGTCGTVPIQFAFFFNLDGDPGCDPQSTVAGQSQGLAALANVTGHELSEARTDPRGAGWFDSSGAENGDKCAWSFGSPQVTFTNGTSWKIQGNWSNIAYNLNQGYANTSGQLGCLDGNSYLP
jgi:hypothetical protein